MRIHNTARNTGMFLLKRRSTRKQDNASLPCFQQGSWLQGPPSPARWWQSSWWSLQILHHELGTKQYSIHHEACN